MAPVATKADVLGTLQALTILYHEYDRLTRLLENRIGKPICVRCGECCEHNTPFAYGMEAANVVSVLIGKGLMSKVQYRIEGWLLDRHKEATLYEPLTLDRVTFGLDDKIRDEALALSYVKCPFYISEDKSCLLHQCRPIVCRAHGVTRVVDSCKRPLGKDETESRRLYVAGKDVDDLKKGIHMILDAVPKDNWKYAGFFPTMIYAHVWPDKFKKMVASGQVATAKLVMTFPTMAVLWQDQVSSMSDKDMRVV